MADLAADHSLIHNGPLERRSAAIVVYRNCMPLVYYHPTHLLQLLPWFLPRSELGPKSAGNT